MLTPNVVLGLNALFLAPAALMGLAAAAMLVKLFSALVGESHPRRR